MFNINKSIIVPTKHLTHQKIIDIIKKMFPYKIKADDLEHQQQD